MSDFYVLDGHDPVPATVEEWGRWLDETQTPEHPKATRQVAKDTIGPFFVSTVFLGMNHRLLGDGPPLLFETMLFDHREAPEWDQHLWRYATWAEAEAGHARVVAEVTEGREP